MSPIRREGDPCWVVSCDHCGGGDNLEYETSFHHESEQALRESARDLEFYEAQDGRWFCPECVENSVDEVPCPRCCAAAGAGCAGEAAACIERITAWSATLAADSGAGR